MVERVCPRCQHGNPLENQHCGQCGAVLVRLLPAGRDEQALSVAGVQLPVSLRQVSQGLAIGLAAIAAEAGMAWLRSRAARIGSVPPAITQAPASLAKRPQPGVEPSALGEITTIVSQRILEVWENGELTRKVIERSAWRKTQS
jgi:hypothetical protein